MNCTCGRGWVHCRICGGKNVYRMQTASMESGYDTWKCKKCMIATNETTPCKAPITHEVKEFVSKEKAIRDLAKIPLEERLNIMIANGATVEEVKEAIRMAGLQVNDLTEEKPELVIQKVESPIPGQGESELVIKKAEPSESFSLDDMFKEVDKDKKDENNSSK